MKKFRLGVCLAFFSAFCFSGQPAERSKDFTLHLSFDSEKDILSDFLSTARIFRVSDPGEPTRNPLQKRDLSIAPGRFGGCLRIAKGWSVTKGTANESGADLDLIVATMWGDYRDKPHYWGQGSFYGDRGTVAFWVKPQKHIADPLYPVFLQSSISWGRNERDLLRIDVDDQGRISASLRDIFYKYHRVQSRGPEWETGQWQHLAVVYDRAYGLKLYRNGRLVASNWGRDAWWQAPLPGLFSPFYPESDYDEIYFFDRPLDDRAIQSLHESNSLPPDGGAPPLIMDREAQLRVARSYAPLDDLVLPELTAGDGILMLKQSQAADCHDEKIPAWWVMDGRYELAWPHPYRNFTFILGDVDFHGERVDIDLKDGENPNFLMLEGNLDGTEAFRVNGEGPRDGPRILDLSGYAASFYSMPLDMGESRTLHFPLARSRGTPEGMVDTGSLKFPLSGGMRIHEVGLWHASRVKSGLRPDRVWKLSPNADFSRLDVKYLDALMKLKGASERDSFLPADAAGESGKQAAVEVGPFQSIHLFSRDLNPDLAVDRIGFGLTVIPRKPSDILWIEVRDPANPSRLWAKCVARIKFPDIGKPRKIEVEMDTIDLMLAGEDRLWIELRFAGGETVLTGRETGPEIRIHEGPDRAKSLAEYARHELIPARMQYIKEYNYQPWLFTGEKRGVASYTYFGGHIPITLSFIALQKGTIDLWTNFEGPYSMWYPPDAVLRHDPAHPVARAYKLLTGERAYVYGGGSEPGFTRIEPLALPGDIPSNAPSWAVWERELYRKLERTSHWIVDQQRADGFFWGGFKDDAFIPLGFAGLPFMGDKKSERSFLRLYDGIEDVGAFKDGYCDIWPSDYLHITDIIVARGLMVPYALGDPHVFEREMITARVYKELMDKNNAERRRRGLPPFELKPDSSRTEPKLWGEKTIQDYETTQVLWYWGKTAKPETHDIGSRDMAARELMSVVLRFDGVEEYAWTESMHHTDRFGAMIGRQELIRTALGGRLQGRIEPHPHSHVVSWDDPDPDLARLVSYADSAATRVNLFNFGGASREVSMRLWRIDRGLYELAAGADEDDDGFIDAGKAFLKKERLMLDRFSSVRLTIPSRRNVAVELRRIKALPRADRLPDLAIHPRRDISRAGDTLRVTVHNIGDAAARDIRVLVLDRAGKTIQAKTIDELRPPLDFVPKTADVEFRVKDNAWDRIVIDPENKIDEIIKDNNAAVNGIPGG